MSNEARVAALLIKHKKTLSTAESCSGGLLADRLTNIPGSSAFFKLGVVVYSNDAKKKVLRISPALLARHGAVSAAVAQKMAQQIRLILKTDFGLSITGIAGPTGATAQKPIGRTFIALAFLDKTICQKWTFKGTRRAIKTQATTAALHLLAQFLEAISKPS